MYLDLSMVKLARKKTSLTQSSVSKVASVSRSSYLKVEKSRLDSIELMTLLKILRPLKLNLVLENIADSYPSSKAVIAPNDFGLKVSWFRNEKGLSQEDLGLDADLNGNTVFNVEGGYNSRLTTVKRLCAALDLRLEIKDDVWVT